MSDTRQVTFIAWFIKEPYILMIYIHGWTYNLSSDTEMSHPYERMSMACMACQMLIIYSGVLVYTTRIELSRLDDDLVNFC